MKLNRKWFNLLTILMLAVILLTGCVENEQLDGVTPQEGDPDAQEGDIVAEEKAEVRDLRAYFPATADMTYQFAGEGNEYASFTRTIKHVKTPYVQIHDDNGGTVMARVMEVREDQIAILAEEPEFYSEESLLGNVGDNPVPIEILLKTPLKAGASWETSEWKKEIIDLNAIITVPAGTFHRVIKVQTTSKGENPAQTTDYYAENVGLILREHKGENYEVTSSLESFGKVANQTTLSELAGPETQAVALTLTNVDLPVLAYQLDHQLRSTFQAAYESYINLGNLTKEGQKRFDQVLALYRQNIRHLATPTCVEEQVNRLQEYYDAGAGEAKFPAYEEVQQAKLLSRSENQARVSVTIRKFYPEREWSGAAHDSTFDYMIELVQEDGVWKVEKADIAE